MNTLPVAFEERIKKQFGNEAQDFLEALQSPSPISIRINPGKIKNVGLLDIDVKECTSVPWCSNGFYLKERPIFTLDPLLHGGVYYVQEASSMFLHKVMEQILPAKPVRMLDLCAAPGGKSTLAASLIPKGSLLVSNEVIRNRASILKENIIKWGQDNIVVTNNDPADFHHLEGAFDVILVDAPCSGEGMFRKDIEAIQEWSENNVRLCAERQKRILSDIWNCLTPGGILIYSTCTFNQDENEDILEWLVNEFEAESIEIKHGFSKVTASNAKVFGYHFYPHKTIGEGFFIGVVRKLKGQEFSLKKNKKSSNYKNVKLPEELTGYMNHVDEYVPYLIHENTIGVVPQSHADFIQYLEKYLHVIYKGCEMAEINNKKLKLMPACALWQNLNTDNCAIYDTDRNTALTFLKREDIPLPDISGNWLLVTYHNIGLGWCKNLGNRLNNYYPKEWRIRMQI